MKPMTFPIHNHLYDAPQHMRCPICGAFGVTAYMAPDLGQLTPIGQLIPMAVIKKKLRHLFK
jgi:hypothetical protein